MSAPATEATKIPGPKASFHLTKDECDRAYDAAMKTNAEINKSGNPDEPKARPVYKYEVKLNGQSRFVVAHGQKEALGVAGPALGIAVIQLDGAARRPMTPESILAGINGLSPEAQANLFKAMEALKSQKPQPAKK